MFHSRAGLGRWTARFAESKDTTLAERGDHLMGVRMGRTRTLGRAAGLTVLEVTIALTIVSTVLVASAGAFMSSVSSARNAQRQSMGTVFLQTVMEDLAAQPYDNLLAFNGNTIFDQPTAAASNYSVVITVFVAAVDIQQIQCVMTDRRTNREIGRVSTMRSRR